MREILKNHPIIVGLTVFIFTTLGFLITGSYVLNSLTHGRQESWLAYRGLELLILGSPTLGMLLGLVSAFYLSRTKNIFGWGISGNNHLS